MSAEPRCFGGAPGGGKAYRYELVATPDDKETKALFAAAAKAEGSRAYHEIRQVITPDGVVTCFATIRSMSDAFRWAGMRIARLDVSRLTDERQVSYLRGLVRISP